MQFIENKYIGMTVNERLYVSGLMNAFDQAVDVRDVDKIRSILAEVELPEESIKPILDQLGR